jgi:hypothetical protein
MRGRIPLLPLCLLFATVAADAQTIVISAGPDRVAVTLYRNPSRDIDSAPDLAWLGGYALISETRQVAIPAGESELRFEGVAGGIVPQSAIIRGIPDGIVERNRDAYLLSPESLLDRSLGRRVLLRRTSLATGAVREQEAVVRSGADGAVLLQTAEGYEALRCTGQRETLAYDGVPQGLAARPTLSVRTRASRPVTATVTLSYLASGFDWQANYVATLSPGGGHISLFAWLVLASGDETSFANAETQAIAGRLNRQAVAVNAPAGAGLTLRCWPQGRTDEILDPAPNLTAVSPVTVVNSEEIVLQGTERSEDLINDLPQSFGMRAQEEALGDLKLFRIPEPVTVAAHSIKQVAFLERAEVPVRIVYRHRLFGRPPNEPVAAARFLLARNTAERGLGIALPAGQVQLFTAGTRPILAGQGNVRDHAVGEEVEIGIGDAPGVTTMIERVAGRRNEYELIVTNDQSVPVDYEVIFEARPRDMRPRGAILSQRDGLPLWTASVPANGTASLRFWRRRRQGD